MKRHLSKSSRATRALRNTLIIFILLWSLFLFVSAYSPSIVTTLFGAR